MPLSASARYWKPIQTGIETDDDTAEVRRLTGSVTEPLMTACVCANPVSPHLAAERAGIRIDLEALTEWVTDNRERLDRRRRGRRAGSVERYADHGELMVRLGLPVVVVARTTLGTINHTLLTIEALRARSLHVAGVVMVGDANSDNRAAIERYGKVAVFGEMPRFDPLTPSRLAEWARTNLDPNAAKSLE